MTAMIYMIFICNSNAGMCQAALSETFQSPQECVAAMVQYYGQDAAPKDGRIYTSAYEWFECEGKPTWQSVQ
jgi:hypothetical protein